MQPPTLSDDHLPWPHSLKYQVMDDTENSLLTHIVILYRVKLPSLKTCKNFKFVEVSFNLFIVGHICGHIWQLGHVAGFPIQYRILQCLYNYQGVVSRYCIIQMYVTIVKILILRNAPIAPLAYIYNYNSLSNRYATSKPLTGDKVV